MEVGLREAFSTTSWQARKEAFGLVKKQPEMVIDCNAIIPIDHHRRFCSIIRIPTASSGSSRMVSGLPLDNNRRRIGGREITLNDGI